MLAALARGAFPDPTPAEAEAWDWVHCQVHLDNRRTPREVVLADLAGDAIAGHIEHEHQQPAVAALLSRSTGALRILARVGGVWRVVSWFRVVPAPLRDLAYRIVARYRYSWFGRFDRCEIPSNDDSARFLD